LAKRPAVAEQWFRQDTATIDHGGGSVVFTLLKNVANTTTCTGGTVVYWPTAAVAVVDTSDKGNGTAAR